MPPVISNQLFFAIRQSPLLPHLLAFKSLKTIRSVGIGSRLPTKRGSRGGKSASRSHATRKFLLFCLMNARSLNSNSSIVQYNIIHHNPDLVVIIETWLTDANGRAAQRGEGGTGYI